VNRVRKLCRKSALGLPDAVDLERMLLEVRQAGRQVKSGDYIRHQDMKTWLLSWGGDHELPPPKCVCGCNV
jgi:hypothetical protein